VDRADCEFDELPGGGNAVVTDGGFVHSSAYATGGAGISPVFAALGDTTRLAIIRRLCDAGPLSTITITDGTSLSRQGVTKHLRMLEGVGLVRAERVGRDCVWQLRRERVSEVRDYLNEISAQWDEAISRLRAAVEA
jgi:DNA-binding transcriptional ArsR family regulator